MMRTALAWRGAFCGAIAATAAFAVTELLALGDVSLGVALPAALGLIALGAIIGYVAFRGPAAALQAVSEAADRIAAGDLSRRVESPPGPTEALTHSFNVMAQRLQELFETVAAEHARLEAVFAAATDAMIALSRDTSVQFLNPAAEGLLGIHGRQPLGRPFIECARDFELDALVRRAIGRETASESTIITFGPRRIPLRAVAVPIRGGGEWAVLLILNDLTEVQRVDAVRRDFVGNVSHELRTPLASIRALVESLQEGWVEDPDDVREFLRRIHQQVDRLTVLVNELLDLSRIESGALELTPEEVDVHAVLREAASLLEARAAAQGVQLHIPEGEGPRLEADRQALIRIVSNLLDNAIKFSPRGAAVRAGVADEGELIALTVADEGPGIAPGDLPRVFERFYKGDTSRANGGVGLGLAIVKHLVRVHGGTVEAASPPGGGAVFTVRLPRRFVGSRHPSLRKGA